MPRYPVLLLGALALLAAMAAWSLAVGRFGLSPGEVARVLWAALHGGPSGLPANAEAIVLQVRGPRVVAALAVGAALAAAGAGYQNLFRNPLVSPDVLGVTAGCALGAGIAVLLGWPAAGAQAFAFVAGLAAVGLVLLVGHWVGGRDPVLTLVLTGVVVGSLFAAGVALVKYVADPFNELPAITFWLLGSFAGTLPGDLPPALAAIAVGIGAMALLRSRMDLLSLTDDEARSLGTRPARLRLAVILAATLATASAVSIAGTIGWVGLVIPHAARLLAGAAFRRVLPLAVVLGAAFMLAVDTACRVAFATEVPPGVVTAFVGTPVFIVLLAATLRRH